MANGKIRFGKQSGGQLALVIPDGVTNTEVIVPESGELVNKDYADGKTTLVQVQAEISTGSNLITSPTGSLGYGTGAGGTVTQLTSKSTTVTLNKPTGKIIMNNSALAVGASISFLVKNNLVSNIDSVFVTGVYESSTPTIFPDNYRIEVSSIRSGVFVVRITNISTGTFSEALAIQFSIIKGAVL